MAITESRLKQGTLTFGDDATGTTVFACQATNVHVTPSYDDDGDAEETLCGDEIAPGKKESYVIGGTSIQDFDNPEGFLAYCYENAMTSKPFTWQPNVTGAPTFAGTCVILALEEGGDVNARLDTDWEFDVNGRPSRTYDDAAGPATGATAGTPGTWTPAGASPPADSAGAGSVAATPGTAWTTGQYVQGSTAGASGEMHWDGAAWAAGRAT